MARFSIYTIIHTLSFNPCLLRRECEHNSDLCEKCSYQWGHACSRCKGCYTHCPDFIEQVCERLKKPPYVCLGCPDRRSCRLQKRIYSAKSAQAEYEAKLRESRQGIATTREDLDRIDNIISPLVRQGQSIHHICVHNADAIMLDEKTIWPILRKILTPIPSR